MLALIHEHLSGRIQADKQIEVGQGKGGDGFIEEKKHSVANGGSKDAGGSSRLFQWMGEI